MLDSGEIMDVVTIQKIEETVKAILREADMDHMTEFQLRIAASDKLGFDLSGVNHKKLVRDVLEAFLLSTPADETVHQGQPSIAKTTASDEMPGLVKKDIVSGAAAAGGEEDERIICKLSERRNATVQKYRGQAFLSIGERYQRKGKQDPDFRGLHFSANQWSTIKSNFAAIEEAIKQFQSNRSQSTQNGDTSMAADDSTHGFFPVETSRFDGKSYLHWSSQMNLFLKQLNLTYVLSEPCPSTTGSSHETNVGDITKAESARKNWLRDDYLCQIHLLNSLSDHLYCQYSKKFKHAKELWDDLKWVYQCEESNSKRSQVRKYIEFKMIEERPILEQVQDFNKIADTIVSAGMFLDETFHVSTIVSKFPPSWRGFCNRLMEEEFLPVWMLMERVKAEEELLINGTQKLTTYRPITSSRMERRPSLGATHRGSQSIGWKRKEAERDGRVNTFCNNCGKKGHLAKNCWGKKSDEKASGKLSEVTSLSSPAPMESETPATTNNGE